MLAELREIAANRAKVLEEIAVELEKLKPKQAPFDQARVVAGCGLPR
ncbi:hypothetical protein HD597_012960 [Nonomuraea thailandensis]|uniref:Uncharacterized protein n=1 Tax=Nonomuraea thailandensis TaxID=1188745 RepID=A0A9X2GVG4_9ACTN|nr:hypothetical protein [Nonomuraea thailandensis]MCP2365856.1 hypothetical protein [Nonomuraea thailandensis]